MKITLGEWKTRDGRKAIVAAENDSAVEYMQIVGWIGSFAYSWSKMGRHRMVGESMLDLIAPWSEPVPWDWSTTSPWFDWIAMDADGEWTLFDTEPEIGVNNWLKHGHCTMYVPQEYWPKWSGNWELSKTMRPRHKEVK